MCSLICDDHIERYINPESPVSYHGHSQIRKQRRLTRCECHPFNLLVLLSTTTIYMYICMHLIDSWCDYKDNMIYRCYVHKTDVISYFYLGAAVATGMLDSAKYSDPCVTLMAKVARRAGSS